MGEINSKNVLYLSYDGMTDPLGQSQVLPYLKGLSKAGYQFHLISFEKEDRFQKFRESIQKICDESNITWHPLSYTKNPPVLSTIADVYRMEKLAFKLHKENHFSIVHCRSYLSALVGLNLQRKKGVKFLFDMRGFWADERVDGKIWDISKPLYRTIYNYFKGKEIEFFKKADHVVSLTHEGKKEIESWEKLQNTQLNIEVIPCCVDLDLFNPHNIHSSDVIDKKNELGLSSSDRVLGYVGSIGTWYMLPEMLEFFKSLHHKDSSWKFLFVTGEEPSKIKSAAKQIGIEESNIHVVSCLHKEVPLFISLFDLSVFFIRPSYSKKASSPTKQGEIMAMGIPLVCNSGVGDTDKIVHEYNAGFVFNSLSTDQFEKFDFSNIQFDKDSTQKGAHSYFGLTVGTDRYLRIYQLLNQ